MNQWYIVYENKSEAVIDVFTTVSRYVTPVCVNPCDLTETMKQQGNLIYIGIKGMLTVPENGYRIQSHLNEYHHRIIVLDGDGDTNLLYAAVDFRNKYLVKVKQNQIDNPVHYAQNAFGTSMIDYDETFVPHIARRALWTWGYVIYDYRGYIDNMLTLKLNTLIIWNDFPPINADELVDYAHRKGIKVIWGFSWGWSTNCESVDIDNLDAITQEVLTKYEKNYSHLKGDGIYFQTFTELSCDSINGSVIAEAAVSLVNQTAARLLERHPQLEIIFGLHATSVKSKLEYIKHVDERVQILWENCGSFPFSNMPCLTEFFEETTRFTDDIKKLRNGGFGELFKGMSRIDWGKFQHQPGAYVIGETSKELIAQKSAEAKKTWKYIQALWLSNAKYVKKEVEKLSADTLVAALVEDGLFDQNIWYPVALYAEILWNPHREIENILTETALSEDVDFA